MAAEIPDFDTLFRLDGKVALVTGGEYISQSCYIDDLGITSALAIRSDLNCSRSLHRRLGHWLLHLRRLYARRMRQSHHRFTERRPASGRMRQAQLNWLPRKGLLHHFQCVNHGGC